MTGSESAQEALEDLERAGLGRNIHATILSVAELWLPPPDRSPGIKEPFPPNVGAAPVNMLLVGVDGSPGSDAAVHEVAKRASRGSSYEGGREENLACY